MKVTRKSGRDPFKLPFKINCDIKTQVSRRFNIAPNTFFLFYQDQPIFKMLDSYNDKIIFVKEFLPIKFLPNEDLI